MIYTDFKGEKISQLGMGTMRLPVINGVDKDIDEEKALEILKQDEVDILVDLNMGLCDATAWGCDLSYDYVRISGGYRRQ